MFIRDLTLSAQVLQDMVRAAVQTACDLEQIVVVHPNTITTHRRLLLFGSGWCYDQVRETFLYPPSPMCVALNQLEKQATRKARLNMALRDLINAKPKVSEELRQALDEAAAEVDKWEPWQRSLDPQGESG